MEFAHVKDSVTRSVLMGDVSEDALCHAIQHTLECAERDYLDEEIPYEVSYLRLTYAYDASDWWNEEGDSFRAVDCLKLAWEV